MIRPALIAATLLAAPAGAAVYVPVPHVFHDGSTLLDIAGMDPDFYDGGKVKSPVAGYTPQVRDYALPCRWYEYKHHRDYCGYPAVRLASVAPAPRAWLWDDWRGSTVRYVLRPPSGGTPAPIPLPAAGWLLIAGIAGLFMVKRRKA